MSQIVTNSTDPLTTEQIASLKAEAKKVGGWLRSGPHDPAVLLAAKRWFGVYIPALLAAAESTMGVGGQIAESLSATELAPVFAEEPKLEELENGSAKAKPSRRFGV